MEISNHIIRWLRKPFPVEETPAQIIRMIIGISVFIFLFLYVFQPLDISNNQTSNFWMCLGYGVVAFMTMMIYEFLISPTIGLKRKRENFTFGKWILYLIGMMFLLSLVNFLFIRLFYFGYILWEYFPDMIYGTFTIGVIPTFFLGALALIQQERKYQSIAAKIQPQQQTISETKPIDEPTLFDIPIHEIRYVEALQNYVKIAHLDESENLNITTHRATLKSIMTSLRESELVKCHRSYIVNRESIISLSGNAQGLLLTLANCDKNVPVSRSYVKLFRDRKG